MLLINNNNNNNNYNNNNNLIGDVSPWTQLSIPQGYWSSVAMNNAGTFIAAAQWKDSSGSPGSIYTYNTGYIKYYSLVNSNITLT